MTATNSRKSHGRVLGRDEIEPALIGGVLLSAGGSGRARVVRDRAFAARAFDSGEIRLAPIAELDADARLMIATAVGAPGSGKHLANADHSISAARQLLDAAGRLADGVIPGHVPGIYGWLLAAALGIPLVDAACNGRGHPTVNMGSLGLSSRSDVELLQSGVGDALAITVRGNTTVTSALMRAAAVQNGGLLMAARGLLSAALVRDAGAVGAISAQIGLGRAILGAGTSGDDRIDAALGFLRGRLLVRGEVVATTVKYQGGFDAGTLTVRDARSGQRIELAVCNEFMAATIDGERVATFPDLLAVMDPATGDVMAISELPIGAPAAVIATSKRHLSMGSGIFDPTVYGDVEQAMGIDIAKYALDPDA